MEAEGEPMKGQQNNNQTEHRHIQTKKVINRLSRVEGHVRAIKRMLEEDRPCPEVLIQLAAVKSAIQKTSQIVLEDHIQSCMTEAVDKGTYEVEWQNLKKALDKYID
jgi:CsoR family transcriptional regulator, copper-sensing transcriptional repressor